MPIDHPDFVEKFRASLYERGIDPDSLCPMTTTFDPSKDGDEVRQTLFVQFDYVGPDGKPSVKPPVVEAVPPPEEKVTEQLSSDGAIFVRFEETDELSVMDLMKQWQQAIGART